MPTGMPLVAGISGLSTAECVTLTRRAVDAGSSAIMALPVYVYRGDWRETKAHYSAVIGATTLSCMLYNNPIAYGTDVVPDQLGELAQRHENLHGVKE
jgi:dihydrodipicolinate synthase/N-acetylneuraminate lyase